MTKKKLSSFWINSRQYDCLVKDNETLLETLRYNLDLIGTKQGCDKGDCGACTVLINDEPHLSCLTLASLVQENDQLTTIEAFGEDLLVEAFDKCGALQCGFCQPGMILSAKALLNVNKTPSLDEVRLALSGNLCRCTGYTKIYLAVLAASQVLSRESTDLDQAILKLREQRVLS